MVQGLRLPQQGKQFLGGMVKAALLIEDAQGRGGAVPVKEGGQAVPFVQGAVHGFRSQGCGGLGHMHIDHRAHEKIRPLVQRLHIKPQRPHRGRQEAGREQGGAAHEQAAQHLTAAARRRKEGCALHDYSCAGACGAAVAGAGLRSMGTEGSSRTTGGVVRGRVRRKMWRVQL